MILRQSLHKFNFDLVEGAARSLASFVVSRDERTNERTRQLLFGEKPNNPRSLVVGQHDYHH